MVSALLAVAAQACGIARLGFINPSLYAMASTGFTDVTTGSNDLYNVGEYSAGPRLRHGLGTRQPRRRGLLRRSLSAEVRRHEEFLRRLASRAPRSTCAINVTATLHDTNNDPLTNALVNVTATNVTATVRC